MQRLINRLSDENYRLKEEKHHIQLRYEHAVAESESLTKQIQNQNKYLKQLNKLEADKRQSEVNFMEFSASVEKMLADISPIQLPLAISEDEVILTNLTTFATGQKNEDKKEFAKWSLVGELARHANILDVAKGMNSSMESEYGGIWQCGITKIGMMQGCWYPYATGKVQFMMTVRDVVCVIWQVYDNIDDQTIVYRVPSNLQLESTDRHVKDIKSGKKQDE